MADDASIEARFWKDLKASPFVMLGVEGTRDGHTQPMTAQFEGESGPIWFFATKDNGLTKALSESNRAIATYTGKGHDLFASIHGTLSVDTDRENVDRLWSPQVEAWYKGGKADPNLALLRLDTERARLWLGGSSFGAAIERLVGKDPKDSYKDNVAEVTL
ncbi:pyridoxamine 5'-phosphate oxidase family protein [Sphingomonas prati]|uniref:General stress protein 26 n=1 Tax=Sphingomonas prati TaxID=1843237 RepID=A0A7W9BUA5_9SPHN|nr:pyridoxamine 5'-phosphate oxidase family protein [Sphingomonas prati]MBB5730135.1 general stress protein 26 [Sphingomonas prati]GGE91751.1 general stress protein [Sphingomonas prati]